MTIVSQRKGSIFVKSEKQSRALKLISIENKKSLENSCLLNRMEEHLQTHILLIQISLAR